MNRESLLRIVALALFLIFSCHSRERVYVLSPSSELSLPFRAASFFGFFDKEGLELKVDVASNPSQLINLLNFSKYSVVIADRKVALKLSVLSNKWVKVCLVALKSGSEEPIKDGKYYLMAKERLLLDRKAFFTVVRGWNLGVELLNDRAVLYYLTGLEELRGIRFLKCKGTDED